MKKYKVYWYSDLTSHKFLEKETPEEAYESFLKDSPIVKNESVCVSSDEDFFAFDDHIITNEESSGFRQKMTGRQLEFKKLKEKGHLPKGVKTFTDFIGHALLAKRKKEAELFSEKFQQLEKAGNLPKGIRTEYQFLAHIRAEKKAEADEKLARLKQDKAKLREEEIKQKKLKEEEELRDYINQLADYLKASGFEALDKSHLSFIFELVQKASMLPDELTKEEMGLIGVALEDSKTYRLLTLRMAGLASKGQELVAGRQAALLEDLAHKLSSISSTTGAIKTAGMAASLLASRNLGKDIAEGLGGDE